MGLQQKLAKLLTKRETLTSKQCAVEIEKIGKRLEVIRARSKEITSSPTGRGKLGPERERIAETGSPQDLIDLNHEEELLDAEDSSLCYQRDALRVQQAKAEIEESPGLAKAAIKRLGPALKAFETATAARDAARGKLESIKIEITAARRTATRGGIRAPVVNSEQFGRLAEALGWHFKPVVAPSKENMQGALQRRQIELTDYRPETVPVFETQGQEGAARKKQDPYLREPRVPEVAGG